MHALLAAVMDLGRDLELPQVLHGIVEAAVTLTDAEYGALGVIGDGDLLSRFLPVGMADELAARIGPAPCGHGILGELIRNPVPLRLDDLTRHPSSFGFPAHHPPMRTFLGAPIRIRDEVFGNIYLTEKRGDGGFDADDEAVLTTLSAAAGVAIDNARLYHDSRRREHRLEALAEITRALLAGTDPDRVLRLIARRAREVADADLAAILLPGGPGGELAVQVADGDTADTVLGARLPAGGSLAGLAARTRRPAVSADVRTDARARPLRADGAAAPEHGPVVAVPLPVDDADAVCGALRLARRAGRPGFDATEVELLSGFADQASIALELARRRAESEELAVLHDRDRIARDLHDLAIQRLFATGMTLQSATRMIGDQGAAERVSRAVDDLDATIQIIRSTILQLRTTAEDRGGPALRRRMAETVQLAAQSLGFPPSLRITGAVDSAVPEELAEQVLAVTVEALSNSARHARAGRADVVLSVPEPADRIVLTITDDGVGLGAAAPTGGLLNMRSRAEQYGGTLELQDPGGGTRVVWTVPLHQD
ncbi:GAF domain-containing protein [Streptomyces sp. NPDC094032]|uniref:sensor histidine kinase n=1 Tax=Streptomyces sp. NPDC094032 TaxID=3155308 RepID=UPI00332028A6